MRRNAMAIAQHDEQPSTVDEDGTDPRPRFAIGHLGLPVDDVGRLTEFYTRIGMRPVVNLGRMSIIELRGGTHIILSKSDEAGSGSLDLIVDDIDDTWVVLADAGANPTPITRGSPHDTFTAADPEGNELIVRSTHAIGPV